MATTLTATGTATNAGDPPPTLWVLHVTGTYTCITFAAPEIDALCQPYRQHELPPAKAKRPTVKPLRDPQWFRRFEKRRR